MRRPFSVFVVILSFVSLLMPGTGAAQEKNQSIDLSGQWAFGIDSLDQGVLQKWFSKKLNDVVHSYCIA